jgi:hypothetical protein
MIIIYTTAKTPQTLTRLSLSLYFSLPFSFHFLIRRATSYRLISLPPSFPLPTQPPGPPEPPPPLLCLFPFFSRTGETAQPQRHLRPVCITRNYLQKGNKEFWLFFLTKKAGEPVDFEWTQK